MKYFAAAYAIDATTGASGDALAEASGEDLIPVLQEIVDDLSPFAFDESTRGEITIDMA
jgi:hypothetical protein